MQARKIVLPGEFLGETRSLKAGRGTFIEHGKIYAMILGIFERRGKLVQVIPIKGRYEPVEGDFVIGIIEEAMPSSWLVDINAPYPALLHVSETPWDIEFGDTEKYLKTGDSIMAKVLFIDVEKKLQLTLNDRNLYRIRGGHIIEVEPSKVPRIIGKKGSMINLIKRYTRCRIIVGQNGRIWLDGDDKSIAKVLMAIKLIEEESVSYGLTNKVENLLKMMT
ncbi:MAG: RNA-binding protein [Thermoplasmata archaeon]|nr:MAG: RNA-binding protein [Thermoplasmata archaeon]HEC89215.1 RNA-binding protein [Thermoplasmatales archaeon]